MGEEGKLSPGRNMGRDPESLAVTEPFASWFRVRDQNLGESGCPVGIPAAFSKSGPSNRAYNGKKPGRTKGPQDVL